MATQYIVFNATLPTTAAPVKQPTGTSIRTMFQAKFTNQVLLKAWGISGDLAAQATPGQVELFETTVAATMSTALVNGDVQLYNNQGGVAQGSTSNVPVDVTGASTSGFATAAVTEGTVANYRAADLQMLCLVNPYVYQWPLGNEFQVGAGKFLRCRVTFAASVNVYVWVVFEV